jgi:hypothetical protein
VSKIYVSEYFDGIEFIDVYSEYKSTITIFTQPYRGIFKQTKDE